MANRDTVNGDLFRQVEDEEVRRMEAPAFDEEMYWYEQPLCLHISQRWVFDEHGNLFLECLDCGDLEMVEPGEARALMVEGERIQTEQESFRRYREFIGDHRG